MEGVLLMVFQRNARKKEAHELSSIICAHACYCWQYFCTVGFFFALTDLRLLQDMSGGGGGHIHLRAANHTLGPLMDTYFGL